MKIPGICCSVAPKLLCKQELRLEFLLVVVDKSGAHLWTWDGEHPTIPHDEKGFVAIGRGMPRAMTALCHRPNLKAQDLPTVVYAVYEAKKASADNTANIGEKTDMVILQAGKSYRSLTTKDLEPLDEAYQKMRPRDLTPEARAIVDKVLASDQSTGMAGTSGGA
jgi:20S proteasome alpha/beta subunit